MRSDLCVLCNQWTLEPVDDARDLDDLDDDLDDLDDDLDAEDRERWECPCGNSEYRTVDGDD